MDSLDGRYVSFIPKQDGTNEVISAEHINELQDVAERTQQSVFKSQDRDFLDKALFVLEHHRILNAMWLDTFEDTKKVDLVKSKGILFSEVEQGIVLEKDELEGEVYSVIHSNMNASNIKQLMLIAAGYAPVNTKITTYISNNGVDWIQVVSASDSVISMPTEGSFLLLKAVLKRDSVTDESPRLDAWAVLYRDEANAIVKLPDGSEVDLSTPSDGTGDGGTGGGGFEGIVNIMHSQLMGIGPDDHHAQYHTHDGTDGSGLVSHTSLTDVGEDDHHPKDHQHGVDGVSLVDLATDVKGTLNLAALPYMVWTGKPGSSGLYFDPTIGDKLVYVKTPDDETYLFYDMTKDQLSHTITIVQGIAVWETLHFTPYTNSAGEVTEVLGGTDKKHYDATDPMIINEIASIAAPAAPAGLTVVNPGTGSSLILNWMASPEFDVVGYNVQVSTDAITWTSLTSTGVFPTNSFVANSLVDGVEYFFRVQAVDATGFSSNWSDIKSGISEIADTMPPTFVVGLSATKVTSGEALISWTPSTELDVEKYTVYHSASGGAGTFNMSNDVLASVGSSFVVTGLTPLTTYYFYVTATDYSGNESVPSSIVSVIV